MEPFRLYFFEIYIESMFEFYIKNPNSSNAFST